MQVRTGERGGQGAPGRDTVGSRAPHIPEAGTRRRYGDWSREELSGPCYIRRTSLLCSQNTTAHSHKDRRTTSSRFNEPRAAGGEGAWSKAIGAWPRATGSVAGRPASERTIPAPDAARLHTPGPTLLATTARPPRKRSLGPGFQRSWREVGDWRLRPFRPVLLPPPWWLWLRVRRGDLGVKPAAGSGARRWPGRETARLRTGGGTDWRPAVPSITYCRQTACCLCCRVWGPPAPGPARVSAPLAALSGGSRARSQRPSPDPDPDRDPNLSQRPFRSRGLMWAGETAFLWRSWCKFSGCWWQPMGPCRSSAGILLGVSCRWIYSGVGGRAPQRVKVF